MGTRSDARGEFGHALLSARQSRIRRMRGCWFECHLTLLLDQYFLLLSMLLCSCYLSLLRVLSLELICAALDEMDSLASSLGAYEVPPSPLSAAGYDAAGATFFCKCVPLIHFIPLTPPSLTIALSSHV